MADGGLVGRSRELGEIHERLEAARRSAGSCLVLCGDAGIGKTTVLEAAAAEAAGFTVLRTRGVESDAELPFTGMVELLRPVTHLLSRLPEPQSAALEVALAMRTGSPADRLTLGAAMLNLLAGVAEGGPVLVMVDDAQWIDATSAEVLVFAAHRLAADAVLMLVADRLESGSRFVASGLDHRRLAGLSRPEAQELAARAAGRVLSVDEAQRLYATTDGNPLGVVELAATVPASGPLGAVPALTPRLEKAFVSRLGKLSADAMSAAVVTAASTLGDSRVVADALTGLQIAPSALAELEEAGLLALSGAHLTFRHPLIRSAVYSAARGPDRRAAHAALAEALAGSPDPTDADERAWHLAAAAWGTDEAAAVALDAAAERAYGRGSLAAAAAAASRAAELSAAGDARNRRLTAAAEANLLMGRHQDALALLPPVSLDSPDLLARVAQVRTQVALVRAAPREVHDRLVAMAGHVVEADPGQAVALLTSAAGAAAMSGDAGLAVLTSGRAVALAGDRSGIPRGSAQSLRAQSLLLTGQVGEAERALEVALAELGTVDPLQVGTEVHPFLAMALMWAERWDDGRRVLGTATRRARTAAPERMPNLLAIEAELEFRTGRWDAALALATEAVDLAVALEQPIGGAYAASTWARVAAHRGDADECGRLVALGREMLAGLGAGLVEPYLDLAAANLRLGAGDYAAAARDLSDLDERVTATGARYAAVLPYQADLVEACWRAGLHEPARDALERFRNAVRDRPPGRVRADLARCEALLAPDDERYARAQDWARGQADPFALARTRLDEGMWLLRERRRGDARKALEESAEIFTDMHARTWSARATGELRAAGARAVPAAEPAAPDLTVRELQIARLVANGATNREAAASLYVSVKTVEYHLGHVYDKLGVRSRTELALRLPQLRAEEPWGTH